MSEKVMNFLKTNKGLKVASLAAALLLWLLVINLNDPVEKKTIARIPITVLNDQVITNAGKVYNIPAEEATVSVICSAKKTDLNSIRADDFYAYVDMKYSYGNEENQKAVKINVEKAKDSDSKDMILEFRIASQDDVMYFTTEDIITKSYNIEVIQTGEVAEGFELNGTLVANPGHVEVTGPESAFANVSKAAVTVDVSQFNGEVGVLTGPVVLYDGNGKAIDNKNLVMNVGEASVSAEVLRTQKIQVSVEGVSGMPAADYRVVRVYVEPKEITVAGLRVDMANLTGITIPANAVDVEGMTETTVLEVDITPYLPENIRVLEASNVLNVTVEIEKLTTKTLRFESSRIQLEGMNEKLDYDLAGTCAVTVEGLKDDLDALDPEDIGLILDVAGVEAGEYILHVTVELPTGYTLYEDSVINVVITEVTEEETEAGSELDTSPESEATSARMLLHN